MGCLGLTTPTVSNPFTVLSTARPTQLQCSEHSTSYRINTHSMRKDEPPGDVRLQLRRLRKGSQYLLQEAGVNASREMGPTLQPNPLVDEMQALICPPQSGHPEHPRSTLSRRSRPQASSPTNGPSDRRNKNHLLNLFITDRLYLLSSFNFCFWS